MPFNGHQVPSGNERWRGVCDCCGGYLGCGAGVAGTPEEQVLLKHHGWRLVNTCGGDCWIGPYETILSLYQDGTWWSSPVPDKITTLEEYLNWYSEVTEQSFDPLRTTR